MCQYISINTVIDELYARITGEAILNTLKTDDCCGNAHNRSWSNKEGIFLQDLRKPLKRKLHDF